jgi:8-oxo-dGTP pyrophosphatase MutT (NUDIX family)
MTECEWFYKCHDESVAVVEHPTVGDVEICHRHLDWIQADWSPTKMVPPLAAKHAARLAQNLENLTDV